MGLEPRKAKGLEILFWWSLVCRGKLKSQVCIRRSSKSTGRGKNVFCRCGRKAGEGDGRKGVIVIDDPEKS